MTKAELVEKIYEKSGLATKAKSEQALDAVISAISECLASGDSVTLMGFGSFKVVERAPRTGRNPSTGQSIHIPAMRKPKFIAGTYFKEIVNEADNK